MYDTVCHGVAESSSVECVSECVAMGRVCVRGDVCGVSGEQEGWPFV